MWRTAFDHFLTRFAVTGTLQVRLPDGQTRTYGDGAGPAGAVQIHDPALLRRLCLNPELAFGEGYMDGAITFDGSSLEAVMRLLVRNTVEGGIPAWLTAAKHLRYLTRSLSQRNTAETARARVAHHYDISDDFYRLMLDEDMQYSCAYFSDPGMTLEAAQEAKKAHIARKLCIEPGMRVLDIGCGWGGMALTLASGFGARVTGVTLSENQLATARARAAEAGLADRVEFRLMDYRSLEEQFDRIVSVGMLEHVGAPHFGEYFSKVAALLAPEGVALIHSIGRNGPPTAQSPWLTKYIFPGGYVPSLPELVSPIARTGLWNLDIESLRLHYAMTLRHWLARFEANLDRVRAMYDDRFIRMWRFYLVSCIMVFEERDQTVFQFQLGHKRDAVPITRDYLYRPLAGAARRAAE
ncbi:class I SAM-dependent methyltransferase [Roseobacteraceae bacterium NS-SX3]